MRKTQVSLHSVPPLGRYYFKRLPDGIHSASEVFKWVITTIISDVPGSDNPKIILRGRTLAEQLKLNKKKCQIGVKSIVFPGHIISSEDIKVVPAKNWSNHKKSLPKSVNEFQWFLGMITYLGKLIPNIAKVTSS